MKIARVKTKEEGETYGIVADDLRANWHSTST
jgi:hypothetical protein